MAVVAPHRIREVDSVSSCRDLRDGGHFCSCSALLLIASPDTNSRAYDSGERLDVSDEPGESLAKEVPTRSRELGLDFVGLLALAHRSILPRPGGSLFCRGRTNHARAAPAAGSTFQVYRDTANRAAPPPRTIRARCLGDVETRSAFIPRLPDELRRSRQPEQVVRRHGAPAGPNQHGVGSSDRPEVPKLPRTGVFAVDQLNPIAPWSDVEAAGLTEVELAPGRASCSRVKTRSGRRGDPGRDRACASEHG